MENKTDGVDLIIVDPDDITEPHIPVEHNPMVRVEPAKPMTVLESDICELYSVGKSVKVISERLGVGVNTVRVTLAKPHIRDFVNELVNAQYLSKLEGRVRIINSVIDAKLEKIEEEFEGDLSKATKKDIIDLMQIVDGMNKEKQKKELGADTNVYLNIINQVAGGS